MKGWVRIALLAVVCPLPAFAGNTDSNWVNGLMKWLQIPGSCDGKIRLKGTHQCQVDLDCSKPGQTCLTRFAFPPGENWRLAPQNRLSKPLCFKSPMFGTEFTDGLAKAASLGNAEGHLSFVKVQNSYALVPLVSEWVERGRGQYSGNFDIFFEPMGLSCRSVNSGVQRLSDAGGRKPASPVERERVEEFPAPNPQVHGHASGDNADAIR